MILSVDFNFNFADNRNIAVIDLFNDALGLNIFNDQKFSTAKYKTTIYAGFTRYFHKFQSKIFVLYFSYHKPIVSFLEYNEMIESENNLNIVGINNDDNNANNKSIVYNQGK